MNRSNSNSNLENPASEMYRAVFQSCPESPNEVVRMLFSFMLHHCGGGQLEERKTLMKEVETQTESSQVNLNPLDPLPLHNNKKKRRRRRKKRPSKTDNETSNEVDHRSVHTTRNCTDADLSASPSIPDQNPVNITLEKTEVCTVDARSESYRSELLGQQYRNRYSRSSSSSSSTSSVSRSRSRSRSRRSSPSFLSSRRITSARRLPVSYCRNSPRKGREKKRRRMRSSTSTESSRSRSSGGRERSESNSRCSRKKSARGK